MIYKIIKLYKGTIDRWLIKALVGSGLALLGINIPWYWQILINIGKEESEKHLGSDYHLNAINWTTIITGAILVLIGILLYVFNKSYEESTRNVDVGNSDIISDDDWPIVKQRILENLRNDSEKLEELIVQLGDESNSGVVEKKYELNSSDRPLLARNRHLYSSARSEIENEEELRLIQRWLANRKMANNNMSLIRRTEYIEEHAPSLRSSLAELIQVYENMGP